LQGRSAAMNAHYQSRRQFLEGMGLLVVSFSLVSSSQAEPSLQAIGGLADVRTVEPENLDSWLAIGRDGSVTVFSGRVELGTGTETVLAQFVAEELDVPFDAVHIVLGDTRLTPDQGKTTASFNVVRGSQPLRVAAAQARAALLDLAAAKLGVRITDLSVENGVVRSKSGSGASVTYGELIGDKKFNVTLEVAGKSDEDISRGVMLKPKAELKAFKDYKVLGLSIRRVELPAKIFGTFEYVHNIRLSGMLHGR